MLRKLVSAFVCNMLFSCSAWAAGPHVVFMSPEPKGSVLWTEYTNMMAATADDLGVKFETVYSKPNGYRMNRDGMAVLKRKTRKPDFFITGYWPDLTNRFIAEAEKNGINMFLINTTMPPEERDKVGRPRQKFKRWIGGMSQDEVSAGYKLAEALLQRGFAQGRLTKNTRINFAAVGGDDGSFISNDRIRGLQRKARQSDKFYINKIIASSWTPKSAEISAKAVLDEFPNTDIIWAASDSIALGCIDAVKDIGKVPGKDILVGGMDWTQEALQAIEQGSLTASYGGAFMDAIWSIVLVHDYYYGIDFKDDVGLQVPSPTGTMTKENVAEFTAKIGDRNWDNIDFRAFSKKYNGKLRKYRFTVDALLEQIKEPTTAKL